MPFSSLSDPLDLARARAALDAAWSQVKSTDPDRADERERNRLAAIVVGLAQIAEDDDHLARLAIARYRQAAFA